MLEPGEVVVVCLDKIRELATRVGVAIDGKLYITNYRVTFSIPFLLYIRYCIWKREIYRIKGLLMNCITHTTFPSDTYRSTSFILRKKTIIYWT